MFCETLPERDNRADYLMLCVGRYATGGQLDAQWLPFLEVRPTLKVGSTWEAEIWLGPLSAPLIAEAARLEDLDEFPFNASSLKGRHCFRCRCRMRGKTLRASGNDMAPMSDVHV